MNKLMAFILTSLFGFGLFNACDYGTRDFTYPTPLPVVLSGTPISVLVPTPQPTPTLVPTATPQPTPTPATTIQGGTRVVGNGNILDSSEAVIINWGATNFTVIPASGGAFRVLNNGQTIAQFNVLEDGRIFMANLTAASGTPNSICQNAATQEITVNAALTCTVSSARYKHDISTLTLIDALSMVSQLRPVRFIYNSPEELTDPFTNQVKNDPYKDRIRWGFIAEDLANIDPRLSEWNTDGTPNSIDYPAIMALHTLAIQELQAEIESLKSQIAAIK